MGSLPKYISVNIEIRVPIVCKTIAVNKFEISTKTPTKKILKIAKICKKNNFEMIISTNKQDELQ